ncbi:MAG TPA: GNAT family N-acetyltransferase [Candidatus Binatia bacterium]|nr:GNAT family N-acetyltransferase [Candidatus Binatia bacterium]
MSEAVVERGAPDGVRAILRRRAFDDAGIALALRFAERGAAVVARDAGETIGIALAHDSEDERYVGDLFVEPSYRGNGIGRRLLDTMLGGESDRPRAMLLDVREPAMLALAFRLGMGLREPVVRFAGAMPREEELAKMAAGEYRFAVESLDPEAHAFVLDELDRATRATNRPADHAEFARAATGHVFSLNGESVGYAYVWPDGRVGPMACASESYLVQILAYALVTLSRAHAATWCTMLVPGRNRRIARASLRAGLRVAESFTIAGDAFAGDLSRYVGAHRLLF